MRRILVERARQKRRLKQGGDRQRVEIDGNDPAQEQPAEILLALDEALTRLAQEDPVKAELVKLRYFAGLTIPETAKALDISKATADRYWSYELRAATVPPQPLDLKSPLVCGRMLRQRRTTVASRHE
jgi:RNA polymerase sigma factor (TIGR02999 family)